MREKVKPRAGELALPEPPCLPKRGSVGLRAQSWGPGGGAAGCAPSPGALASQGCGDAGGVPVSPRASGQLPDP